MQFEYFLLLCYVKAVPSRPDGTVERTAVSTVVHHVKQSGNTHLLATGQDPEIDGA